MYNHVKAIVDYYDDIDNARIDRVLRLFAENAEYVRDKRHFLGISEIAKFYEKERPIASGRHVIGWLKAGRNLVRTKGEFFGVLKSGIDVTVKFTDAFYFAGNKVVRRVTVFVEGPVEI